ncbi:hypothetical protein GIY56_14575 [Paracoccus sp. YIM 132242]|uniref:O-antigen ligase domain-containing protein n=1 Tax=Paracoccus lichenicola TaxID=2665644 RepID=A0A6L6HTE2_9RHOB|nr:hypothetical protein [Paracoccus lichenicola]MTE01511.1 hypothetical protein [Paracoccus lichenicola]
MGNAFSYLMLLSWPVVSAVLFRRLEARLAFIWSILGAYMLLSPLTSIAMPVIPDLGKDSLSTGAAALLALGAGFRVFALPRDPVLRAMILVFVLWPWATMLGNPEPLVAGTSLRPGLTPYDTFSTMIGQAFMLLPFLAARNVLCSPGSERLMLRALLVGGLAYSLPMLVEVRLSPQINVWIYGYFAHDFIQMMRYGGFRPMVFMSHGLWVALFTFSALASAAALAREQGFTRRTVLAVLWLGLMLLLCKSMAPILYALAVLPLLLLVPPRLMLSVAAVIAATVLVFPLLRLAGLIPVEQVTAAALAIDAERAASLIFRLRNEGILLDRAVEKLWTGWGGYGRNLLVNPASGAYETIADGRWIITLGVAGLPGYVAEFGLFTLPVIAAWRTPAVRDEPLLASLVLIHAVMLIDLIPNATLTPLTFLTAGLVLGRVEHLRLAAAQGAPRRAGAGPGPAAAPAAAGRAPGLRTIL